MLKFLLPAFLLFSSLGVAAQGKEIIYEYIETYKDAAILEMQRTGVPASIKLAQGIHETMAGQSVLVRKSNNHFGIKCKSNWTGPSVSHDDDARGECFRKYESAIDSYRDHSNFLKGSKRYASLFDLDPLDYKGWAYGLKKAGYATNPKYPQIIVKLIEDYNLQDYTLIAMGKLQPKDEVLVKNEGEEGKMQAENAVLITNAGEEANSLSASDYPTGVFTLNGAKVIFAAKGTSFLALAKEHDVALSKIFEYNDLKETEEVEADQLVFLQRKPKTGLNEFHIVREGESLHDIAQREAIRLDALEEYNYLDRQTKPLAGSKIYLRGKAPMKVKFSDLASNERSNSVNMRGSANTSKPAIHVVKAKETLYSISKRYDVTAGDIMKWNNLRSNTLHIGQELKIYK